MSTFKIVSNLYCIYFVAFGIFGYSCVSAATTNDILGNAIAQTSELPAWRGNIHLLEYGNQDTKHHSSLYAVCYKEGELRIELDAARAAEVGMDISRAIHIATLEKDGTYFEGFYGSKRGNSTEIDYANKNCWSYTDGVLDQIEANTAGTDFTTGLDRHVRSMGRNVPAFYRDIERGFDLSAGKRKADATSSSYKIIGTLKSELRKLYESDPSTAPIVKPVSRIELFIDKDTGMPKQFLSYLEDGELYKKLTISEVEFPVDIAHEELAYDFSHWGPQVSGDYLAKRTEVFAKGGFTQEHRKRIERSAIDSKPANVSVGETVPAVSGPSPDGTTVHLVDLQGKVVLIDFWATWCPPCIAELPNVLENYERYREQGFEVLGISLDDDAGALDKFLKEHPEYNWPQICDKIGREESPSLAETFGVGAIPATVLVDRDGTITALNLRDTWLDQELAAIFEAEIAEK